jgi:hypothetical protein
MHFKHILYIFLIILHILVISRLRFWYAILKWQWAQTMSNCYGWSNKAQQREDLDIS